MPTTLSSAVNKYLRTTNPAQRTREEYATTLRKWSRSVEILGHSVGGITYRHYAHRAPLAFRAILSLPQPMAFTTLARGFDEQCPCCRCTFGETGG